jgi:hypothetical protein
VFNNYYISCRYFSSFLRLLDDNRNINFTSSVKMSIVPVVSYSDSDVQKLTIYKENKKKCGIYM